jgi:hypothetical protein
MAWQDTVTAIVRVMINDLDSSNYKYTDQRIQHVAATAATYVQFDVVLDHEYLVDVVNDAITPDPTLDNDTIFISLLSLKTACIIDQSNFRTKAATEGIRASLGPAQIATIGSLSGWKEILEHGPCKLYQEFTEHWDVSNASAVRAILSPFVGNNFDPFMLPYNEDRSRDLYS